MLAGRMKLTHFLAIVIGASAAGLWLLVRTCSHPTSGKAPPALAAPAPAPATTPEPLPVAAPPPATGAEMPARAWDAEVIQWSRKAISGDKQKDVTRGKPYKVNVYRDPGHATVDRAKVDTNRNDKWDEKYSFDGDTITLEIAPADDESYTQTYHWTGSAWLPEGAAPTPAPAGSGQAEPAAGPVDLPARPYDAEVLAWKDRSIPSAKLKDASKGKPYKINVYEDAGNAHVNRAKVDANRNDKWDDKYTFEPSKITLQRAPADDERYTETYHWTGNGWAKQR